MKKHSKRPLALVCSLALMIVCLSAVSLNTMAGEEGAGLFSGSTFYTFANNDDPNCAWRLDREAKTLSYSSSGLLGGEEAALFQFGDVIDNYVFSGKIRVDDMPIWDDRSVRIIFGAGKDMTAAERTSGQHMLVMSYKFPDKFQDTAGYPNWNLVSSWQPGFGWDADCQQVDGLDLTGEKGQEIDFAVTVKGQEISAVISGKSYSFTVPDSCKTAYYAVGFESQNVAVTVSDLKMEDVVVDPPVPSEPYTLFPDTKKNTLYWGSTAAQWVMHEETQTLTFGTDTNTWSAITFDTDKTLNDYTLSGKVHFDGITPLWDDGSFRIIAATVAGLDTQCNDKVMIQMSKRKGENETDTKGYPNWNMLSGIHPCWGWNADSRWIPQLDLPAVGTDLIFNITMKDNFFTVKIGDQSYGYRLPKAYQKDFKAFGFECHNVAVTLSDLKLVFHDSGADEVQSPVEGAKVWQYSETSDGMPWTIHEDGTLSYDSAYGWSNINFDMDKTIEHYRFSGKVTFNERRDDTNEVSFRFIYGTMPEMDKYTRDFAQMIMMSQKKDDEYANLNFISGFHLGFGWKSDSEAVPALDLPAEKGATVDFDVTVNGRKVTAVIGGGTFTYTVPEDHYFDYQSFGFDVQNMSVTVSGLKFEDLGAAKEDENGDNGSGKVDSKGNTPASVPTGESAKALTGLLAVSCIAMTGVILLARKRVKE